MTSNDPAAASGDSTFSLEDVARIVGGDVRGDASIRVRDVAPVGQAAADELGFLAVRRYVARIPREGPPPLLVSRELADSVEAPVPGMVVVDDGHDALRILLEHLHAEEPAPEGIHATAVVGQDVALGEGVAIGPYAVIEEGARLGRGVRIGTHCVVGRRVRIGVDSVLFPHVVVYPGSVLGERVILHSGVRIGAEGFGYVFHDGQHRKIPQVGACIVEDDVEVGANACLDRGSIGRTVVGAGTKIDNLVQVAHNVEIGRHSLLAGQAGIAGSTRLGPGVAMGGQAGVTGHLTVGGGAEIGAGSKLFRSIPAGETVMGFAARPATEHWRAQAALYRLPKLMKRIKEMEERLTALETE